VTALQWMFIRQNPEAAHLAGGETAGSGPLAFAPEALWVSKPVRRR
jgi:hypothetical protein